MKTQKILTIINGDRLIISHPWCFEAMCILGDNDRSQSEQLSKAVYFLFEGTEATDEVLSALSKEKFTALCEDVWHWYLFDMLLMANIKRSGSGESKNKSSGKFGLREMYRQMFSAWGILPDEIGRQRPQDVFLLLHNDESGNEITDLPSNMQVLYGV